MRYEEQTKIDEGVFERVRAIRETKGKEYATVEDTLADFKEVAEEAGVSPLQCWAVYVKKHQRAIDTFIREGSVKSEAIDDRILDVIVYHLLLIGLIEDLEKGVVVHGDEEGAGWTGPVVQTQIPLAHRGSPKPSCISTFTPTGEPNDVVKCSREEGHVGQHESILRGAAVYW